MKISKLTAILVRILVVPVIAILPLTSQAQIEEIVVTAQKREQGINDVGITVSAFSSQQLKNYGVDSADDLEKMVPALTINASQPAGAPVYTIRGVGFNDFTTTASSTVGIYNDGAAIPYPVMTTGILYDIERIEVLKGPQGDLYGRNTTAGQINFINRKPTEETTAGISLGFDNFETLDVEGFVSGSISDSGSGPCSDIKRSNWVKAGRKVLLVQAINWVNVTMILPFAALSTGISIKTLPCCSVFDISVTSLKHWRWPLRHRVFSPSHRTPIPLTMKMLTGRLITGHKTTTQLMAWQLP